MGVKGTEGRNGQENEQRKKKKVRRKEMHKEARKNKASRDPFCLKGKNNEADVSWVGDSSRESCSSVPSLVGEAFVCIFTRCGTISMRDKRTFYEKQYT